MVAAAKKVRAKVRAQAGSKSSTVAASSAAVHARETTDGTAPLGIRAAHRRR